MTEQELYDTTLWHLRKQGKQSTSPTGVCRYKGCYAACAMGVHLRPEEYNVGMERYSVEQLIEQGKWPQRLMNHRALMKELQTAHDIDLAVGPAAWERQMKTIAKYFGLIYTDKD